MDQAFECPIDGIWPEEWDQLASPHFYSSSAWLRYCSLEGGARVGAVVGKLDGQAYAAAPIADFTAPPPALYRWHDILTARGIPSTHVTGLMVGPRQGYQTHFLATSGSDGHDVAAAIVTAVRRLHRSEGADRRACVAMYLTTADVRLARAVGVRSLPVLLEPDAWIPVPADGWEAWLASLPRQRRTNIRREVRLFHDAGYEVSVVPLLDCYGKLGALAAATQAKYGHSADAGHYAAFMRAQGESMGSAAQVALCSRGQADPVGFCIFYIWGGSIFIRWAGFDYRRLAGAAEYFNLVLYHQIALAADVQARWIHAGLKATASKALRGAHLRPLWLLDLTEDSELARHSDVIRASNSRFYQELAGDARTSASIADRDEWLEFC